MITEHEMLVTLANMALKMDDLTGHDVIEALRELGYEGVVEEARAGLPDDPPPPVANPNATSEGYEARMTAGGALAIAPSGAVTVEAPHEIRYRVGFHSYNTKVPKPKITLLYKSALSVGCSPVWGNGPLGWVWNCGCPDLKHATDRECLAISFRSLDEPIELTHGTSAIQLHLLYPNKVNVEGLTSRSGSISYLGEATYSHGDGFYKCLANVDGTLCIVEVKISFEGRS